jgi:carboxyl-terminal processing protease
MTIFKHENQRFCLLRVVAAVALILLCLQTSPANVVSQEASGRKNFEILETVIRYIKADYIEEPDAKKTMNGALQGLINSLDVLSAYLDKAGASKYALSQKRPLNAPGVILFKHAGAFPLVIGVVENSPAEKAGVRMGDYLSAVNNESVLVWSLSEINLALEDESEAPVMLRVIHENATRAISVKRAVLYPRPVTLTAQAQTSGIVKVHHLNAPLVSEFKTTILPKLKNAKTPLILDLRDCYQGNIEEARAFLNLFLKADKAGSFEVKGGIEEPIACPESAPLETLSVAVWVNPATMGPAEVVASVLKDLKKAKVIGLPTPGLASRQEIYPLNSGDAILLTTGVFRTASGEKVWGKGVSPDITLDLDKTDTKAYLDKTLAAFAGR